MPGLGNRSACHFAAWGERRWDRTRRGSLEGDRQRAILENRNLRRPIRCPSPICADGRPLWDVGDLELN